MEEILEKLAMVTQTLDRVEVSGRQNLVGLVVAIDTLGDIAKKLEALEHVTENKETHDLPSSLENHRLQKKEFKNEGSLQKKG